MNLRSFLFSVALIIILAWPIHAQTNQNETITTNNPAVLMADGFPRITFELPAQALDFQPGNDSIRFSVIESKATSADDSKGPGHKAAIQSVQVPVIKTTTDTNTLYTIVIDATLSVPAKDFKQSLQSVQSLINAKPKESQIAIFRINGKPQRIQDFTDSTKALTTNVKKIKRNGKITRIYDSLFLALKETSAYAKKKNINAGAVILFTDGRDEGSYLNEDDCIDIAAKGQDLQIPIFVVLNGSAKNERLFKRMALRSGGELFKKKINFENLNEITLPETKDINLEQPATDKLQIKYRSSLPFWKSLPGSEIEMQAYYDQNLIGSARYKVPGIQAYIAAHPILFSLFFIVLMLLLGGCLWLFLYVRRQNEIGQTAIEEAKKAEAESKLNIPDPYNDVFIDMRSPENNQPVGDDRWIETDLEADDFNEASLPPKQRRRFEKEAMTLNMKEKAYIVLQMALKDAPPYQLGVLIKKQRDMNRLDQRYDLFLDETYIGNSPSATLPVRDHALSSLHAKVKRFDRKYVLFDLGGTTGTFLNGKKLLKPMPLRSGDEIRMGHTMFVFQGESK